MNVWVLISVALAAAAIGYLLAMVRSAKRAENLRAELAETRRLYQEADKRAEANSDAQLRAHNEVLRGLNARDNATLTAYAAELRQLRRARFILRIFYVIFGLALVGLAIFALAIFSPDALSGWLGR